MTPKEQIQRRYKTRAELGNAVNSFPYSVSKEVFDELFRKEDKIGSVGFHSDVYYIRALLEQKTGVVLPLGDVEKSLRGKNADS